MSIENTVIELTAQEIQDRLVSRTLGLIISAGLTTIGAVWGKKAKNEFKKIMGFILTSLGIIGILIYMKLLLELTKLITQIK